MLMDGTGEGGGANMLTEIKGEKKQKAKKQTRNGLGGLGLKSTRDPVQR